MKPSVMVTSTFMAAFGGTIGVRAQCQPQWLPQPPSAALNGPAWGFIVWNGDLVVSGGFSTAGGRPAGGIARWDGGEWHPLSTGVTNPQEGVGGLAVYGGDLVAAGTFTSIGGAPIAYVARWNGVEWASLGTGLTSPAFLLTAHAGGLAAVTYTFNTSHVWLGNGVQWSALPFIPFEVSDVASFDGHLIAAGGQVSTFGGYARVFRWNGSAWEAMGTLPNGGFGTLSATINALAPYRGELFAGGAIDAPLVLRWDGGAWSPLGTLPGWPYVVSLTGYRGDLVASGPDLPPPNEPRIVRWDGAAWVSMGLGLDGIAHAFGVHNNELIAGGYFQTAGGLPSPYWARWGCPCYPDCNNSGNLTVADFGCFQTQFVKGDLYADCNSDNALTVADFGCFQTKFVAGCP